MLICRTSRTNSFNLQSFWPALCHQFFPTGSCSDRWSPSYTFGGVVGWDVGDAAQVDAWSTSNHWSVAECLLKIPFTWATFICRFFFTLNGRLDQLRMRRSLGKRFGSFFGVLWISHSRKDLHLCLQPAKFYKPSNVLWIIPMEHILVGMKRVCR